MVEQLADGSTGDRREAAGQLRRLAECGVDLTEMGRVLVERMAEEQDQVTVLVLADTLQEVAAEAKHPERFIQALVERFRREKDPGMRAYFCRRLGEVGPIAANAVDALVEAAQDRSLRVRLNAHAALIQITQQTDGHLLAIRDALVAPDAHNSGYALDVSMWLGPAASSLVPDIVALLDRDRWQGPALALRAIGKAGRKGIAKFKALIRDPRLTEKRRAVLVMTLGYLKADRDLAVDVLLELYDTEESLRPAAVCALGRLTARSDPALDRLLEAAASPDAEVRASAGSALGMRAGQALAASRKLTKLTSDTHQRVRTEALRGLGAFGPSAAEAVSALVGVIQRQDDPITLLPAVQGLARFRPAAHRAVPVLERLKARCESMPPEKMDPTWEEVHVAVRAALTQVRCDSSTEPEGE
ncbi:MAG: HEAT repeat domain-containing protein [Candidatus Brocadiia bacterium]